jgi:nicotinamide-nucleotide amidase
VVGRVLREKRLTLALAESCTGGLVGHRVTNVPGSSTYFLGGAEVYANSAKEAVLGVSHDILVQHGAVSEEAAREMAVGARRVFGADIAVATTGIAGPDGGTAEKPVGTVCFGIASAAGVVTHTYPLWGTRDWVKLLASQIALDWVRRLALGLPVPDTRFFRRR